MSNPSRPSAWSARECTVREVWNGRAIQVTYRLPELRKGLRLEVRSHEAFEGKRYHVLGTVVVPPTPTRFGTVMVQIEVDKGLVEERKGAQAIRRSLAGQTVWVPWSAKYVHVHIPRAQPSQQDLGDKPNARSAPAASLPTRGRPAARKARGASDDP